MLTPYKRNPVFHLNRFQQRLLFPVIIISIITTSILIFAMLYLYYIGEHVALLSTPDKENFDIALPWFMDIVRYNFTIPVLMLVVASLLVLVVCWAFHITSRIIGPHERVIRELDEVITGARKEPIAIRRGDELFEELLQRINALIEKIL